MRARAEGAGSGVLVAAVTLYAAFNAGGYFADSYGWIAAALLLVMAFRVAVVERPFAGWGRPLLLPAGALALFAAWSLLSVAWSHAAGRTLLEACRVLPYLLALLVASASPGSPLRLRRAAAGLAVAVVAIAAAALATRLAPDVFATSASIQPDRLSFPLTYWNALALIAAIGFVVCFAFASETGANRLVRTAAAAALPGLAATLLLTYSRGGVAIAALMIVLYLAIARPRGAVPTVVATAVPTIAAVVAAYRANLLASQAPTTHAAAAQGHRVGAVVIVAVLVAAALQYVLIPRVESHARVPAVLTRALATRRARRATAVLVTAIVVAVATPAVVHQLDRFSAKPSAAALADTRQRLSDPSSNGRVQYWRAALDAFRAQPLAGTGAGTYQLDWWRYRSVTQTVTEAHSLYLQALAETGMVGLVLVLAALAPLLIGLVRRMNGAQRPLVAALVACASGWLVHAALDWDWQMAAVTLWLFATAGVALARPAPRERRPLRLLPRAALGAVLIAVAGVPALAAISQSQLDLALNAYASGDCPSAADAGRSARAALPPRAEPRMVLGWCAGRAGHAAEAVADLRGAVARANRDWETHYDLAVVLAANGRDPRHELAQAGALDPLEPAVQQLARAVANGSPRTWKRPAVQASLFQGGLPYPPLSG